MPVIDNLATLLARWGAKSTDGVVAKMFAKGNALEAEDYRALRKLLEEGGMNTVDAFRKPMETKIASLDELLADYKRLSAGEKIREVRAVEIKDLGDEIYELDVIYDNFYKLADDDRADVFGLAHRTGVPIDYPASKISELSKIDADTFGRFMEIFTVEMDLNPDGMVELYMTLNRHDDLLKFARDSINNGEELKLSAFSKVFSDSNIDTSIRLYNSFLGIFSDGASQLENISTRVRWVAASDSSDQLVEELDFIRVAANNLKERLITRAKVLDYSGVSPARRTEIEARGWQYISAVSGVSNPSQKGIGGWAEDMQAQLTTGIGNARSKFAIDAEIRRMHEEINSILDTIKNLK